MLASCAKEQDVNSGYSDGLYSGGAIVSDPSTPASPSEGQGEDQTQAGLITAGEWNDLDSWSQWQEVIARTEYSALPAYWSIFNNNRIAVNITDEGAKPVTDAIVKLKRNGSVIFAARTDNFGNAELWADLFQHNAVADFSTMSIEVNDGAIILTDVKAYKDGINTLTLPTPNVPSNRVEIAFVVDATGSMDDELEYLKTELLNVINRVKADNAGTDLLTASVFYRDEGDDYVTRKSDFTTDINTTLNFIKAQSAGGGGDFPEAVHTALNVALGELQWSAAAHTRLLFLLLDAPPHHETAVVNSLNASVKKAAEMGVKIIPITASGIDRETEFLMRFMALSTGGTYVFITDHSGIGGEHLEPTVGEYQVEYLNNLLVRLIGKYAKQN
jgi:hypothetical protein